MHCESFPCAVQPLLSSRHGPGCMAFVEERLAPFDQLIVDLLNDLRAERVVAPVGEREPTAQRGLIVFGDGADPPVADPETSGLSQPGREPVDQLVRGIRQLIVERLDDGRTESLSQTGAQDLAMCDRAGSDGEVFIMNERLQRGIEVGGLNPARFQVVAVDDGWGDNRCPP